MQYSKIFSVVALLVAAAAAAPVCHGDAPAGPAGPAGPGLPGLPGAGPGPAHGSDGIPAGPGPARGSDGIESSGGNQQAAMACASQNSQYGFAACCNGENYCVALVSGICPTTGLTGVYSPKCCNSQPSNQQNNEQHGLVNIAPANIQLSCINTL